jgi:hypothetical protein
MFQDDESREDRPLAVLVHRVALSYNPTFVGLLFGKTPHSNQNCSLVRGGRLTKSFCVVLYVNHSLVVGSYL